MNTLPWPRRLALLVLLGALTACASLPPEPETAATEPAPGTGAQPEPASAEPEPAAPAATEARPEPVIASGEEALVRRRETLAADERAMAPTAVGYFMDVYEARLRQSLGGAIQIRREDDRFRLQVAGRASFDTGSTRVREFLRAELQQLAAVLAEFDKSLVVVHAHTDSLGDDDFNRALSARRALRVAELLVESGVGAERVVTIGHGEADPIATNATRRGRAQNRRLEILIEPVVRAGG